MEGRRRSGGGGGEWEWGGGVSVLEGVFERRGNLIIFILFSHIRHMHVYVYVYMYIYL